jgi:hypothetical protein
MIKALVVNRVLFTILRRRVNMPFQGIMGLRSSDEAVKMEPWQLQEIKKCANDPIYFAKTYIKITTKDKGVQLFDMWDFQETLIRTINENRFTITKFPRQCGKSTTTRAYLLWYALFHRKKTIAILANKLKLAKEQLQQLKDSYMELPYWMQPGLTEWNKESIGLTSGTRIMCASTSPDGIRGMAINVLYLDEFAFVAPHIAGEFIASVFPVVSGAKSTKIIITSCVVKDTYVFTDKGIQQVGEFIDVNHPHEGHMVGGYRIPEYKVMGMRDEMNVGTIMHNDGKKETRIITTPHSDLECSLEHKLWAYKDNEYKWVKTKNIEMGDYIPVKYGMNCWGNDEIDFVPVAPLHKRSNYFGKQTKLTPDICYLLGLYISEGNATNDKTRKRMDITCGDDVSDAFTNLGLRYYLKPDNIHYQLSSVQWIEFLEYLGFDITRHAPRKIIPTRLMQMSKECTSAMLQGIFDGDGYATKDRYRVGISLSSKELIRQIRMLFLNYGILSTYNEFLTQPTELVKVTSMSYRLEVCKHSHVKKYFDEIGFRFDRKRRILESFDAPTRTGDRCDIIPESVPVLRRMKKEHDIAHDIISFSGEKKTKRHWSRDKLLGIKSILESTMDLTDTIFDQIQPDIIWCKVESIESSENYVYDFSLNDIEGDNWDHSVAYNGIIGHNTPNGMNHFYDMWNKAEKGPGHKDWNQFMPQQVPWNAIPGRDAAWAENEKKTIGEIRFNQEYKCDFIGSVSTLIDHNFLKKLKEDGIRDPLLLPKIPEILKIWELPKPERELEAKNWEYAASLDSGYGVHQDSTVLKIYLVKSNVNIHLVAQVSANNIEIEDFCTKVLPVLGKYHNPALVIEQNGPGTAATSFFYNQAQYENLMHFDPKGSKMGLWSTELLKERACVMLKAYVQRRFIKDYDEVTIDEMASFGRVTAKKWGALGGNHDDHVMSMLWVVYYVNSPLFFGNITEIDLTKMMQDAIILDSREAIEAERIALVDLKNTEFHTEEVGKAAEYEVNLGKEEYEDDPTEKPRGSGVNIIGEDDDDDDSVPLIFSS